MFFFVGSRMFDVQSDVTIRLSTHIIFIISVLADVTI